MDKNGLPSAVARHVSTAPASAEHVAWVDECDRRARQLNEHANRRHLLELESTKTYVES